jgi:hypothetical protein
MCSNRREARQVLWFICRLPLPLHQLTLPSSREMDATRRLPAEILAKILLESDDLPLEPINPEAKPYAPLAVCRFWRKTALETSGLWTTIDITVNSETIGNVYREGRVPNSYDRRLRTRERRLEKWLQRSSAQLLGIELDFDPTGDHEEPGMKGAIQALTDSVMQRLLAVASRWQSVMLKGTHRSLFCILSALSRAVCLTTLNLIYPETNKEHWFQMQDNQIYQQPLYIRGIQGNIEFAVPSLTEVHLANIMYFSETFPPFVASSVTCLFISHMLVRPSDIQSIVSAFPGIIGLTLNYTADIRGAVPYSLEQGFEHLECILALHHTNTSHHFLRAIVEKASDLRDVTLQITDANSPILQTLPTTIESLCLKIYRSSDILDILPTTLSRFEALSTLELYWIPASSTALDQRTASVLEALTATEDGMMPIPNVRKIHLQNFPFHHPDLVSVIEERFAHADQNGINLLIKLVKCLGLPDIQARSFRKFEERMLTSVKFNLPLPTGLGSVYD